jgi:membrane fusion protein (multidrug efflux system)
VRAASGSARPIAARLLAAALACIWASTDSRSGPAADARLAPSVAVTTAPLGHEELKDRLKGFGTVTLGEQATNDISFQHGGQVVRLDAQPGQKVKAGQPLVTVTTDPTAALSFRNAVAAQGFAQRDYDRTKLLLTQHLATNAQAAAAKKVLTDAEAVLQNEKALGNDKSTETVSAPVDGFVSAVSVNVGDRIAANTVAMKLSRTDRPPRVTLGLEPDGVGRVRPGMTAFVTPVYGSQDIFLKGTVAGTSATVDPATHLIDTWIDVAAAPAVLPIGSGVGVSIILSEHEATVVPRDAVLHDAVGDYLFMVRDGVAKRVDVKVGLQTDKVTEVLGTFDPAMRVVTVGNYELKDGMAIHEGPPASPQPSATKP